MSVLVITGLLLLPGFKRQAGDDHFPAPVEKPAVAIYANLSVSGLYDQNEEARLASKDIATIIEQLCLFRGASAGDGSKIRSISESFINDRIISGTFKIYELFFYFRDLQNFALILHGEFTTSKIASLIGSDKVVKDGESISTVFSFPYIPETRLHFNCQNDQLVICPENTAGNIFTHINSRKNLLGREHDAFARMVKVRPAIAAEISLESLQKNNAALPFSSWKTPLKHLRLIAATRMAKLQLFVPDSAQREDFARKVEEKFVSTSGFPGNLASFTTEINGGSIFVETPGNKVLERNISSRSAAFLLHFFVKAQKNELILSSTEEYEQ